MGNFYTNYTLRGVGQQAVADVLTGRSCFVTLPVNDTVVVFDAESDQDQKLISELAAGLSAKLNCPVLAVMNHDDDILWYQLHVGGDLQDEYDSSPGYFDPSAERSAPAGGDAVKLCSSFGSSNSAAVEGILRNDGGYAFAIWRHADLVRALDISPFGVGTGFARMDSDELPEGLSAEEVIRTG